MRKPYTELVRHYLRFYVSTLEVGTAPKFRHPIEKNDWMSCHEVVQKLDPEEIELVKELYCPGDTIPDRVYAMARSRKAPQGYLWSFIEELESKIAKTRGLIW